MPERLVEARFTAPAATVLAALTAQLHAQGDQLTGIAGFGSVVTWRSFDGDLELVDLCAELRADPDHPGVTLLRVRRVDAALAAALETTPSPPEADSGDDAARPTG